MTNIGRTLLSHLGLASARPKSPARPQAADRAAQDRADVHESAAEARTGILGRLLRTSPTPLPSGLSVREACRALDRSAGKHVRAALERIPSAERAGAVAAARFLLAPDAPAEAVDAVLQHLQSLQPAERVTLAHSAGKLAATVRLDDPGDVAACVGLLHAVGALPRDAQRRLTAACGVIQPSWQQDVPAASWTSLLRILARVPAAELPQFAKDVRFLHAGPTPTPRAAASFLGCVEQHANLDVHGRATLRRQVEESQLAEPMAHEQTPRAERLRAFSQEPEESRAALLTACNQIFAAGPVPERGERASVAAALLNTPAAQRQALTAILQDVRRAGVPISPWALHEALQPFARALQNPAERQALLADLVAASPRGLNGGTGWHIIRTLAQLPAAERAQAAQLAQALSSRGTLDRRTVSTEILSATPEQRRQHTARLRAQDTADGAPRRLHGARDLENVMQGDLQRQVNHAVEALEKRFARPMPTRRALNEMEVHLHALKNSCRTQPEHALMVRRGGDTEIDNALRTLSGSTRPGDFSQSVRDTPAMAKLCALVWHATTAERPGIDPSQAHQEQELMRYGLVMALAKCIEDDGHRVCGVGQRQHTVDVLKGYYSEAGNALDSVTPAGLVTVLAEQFYKSHGAAPSPTALQSFSARADNTAAERFGAASPQHAEFTQQMQSYLRMTYESNGPA